MKLWQRLEEYNLQKDTDIRDKIIIDLFLFIDNLQQQIKK